MHLLRLVLLVAVAPVFIFQGCDSTSNEPLPNSGQSLCFDLYEMCIDPIFHNLTNTGNSCSQAGCHNPPIGQDAFFLFPGAVMGSTEMMNNFNQVESRTLNNNLLLSKATGNAHGGGQQLRVGDICYTAIQEWSVISFNGGVCPPLPSGCLTAIPANIASCGP
ncbi:MAG: hypothetical protein AAF304_05180 [Pseudomonadota bacterium]